MIRAVASGVLVAAVLYWGVPLLWSEVLRARLKRRVTRERKLVLTFDDGPGNRLTPVVLDTLGRSRSRATFFLLGRNIAGREHLVRRIAAEGHEIGAHGYDHLHYWKTGPLRTLRDIRDGWRAIDRALGRQGGVYPFRPPYGKMNLACLVYLLVRRAPIVYWTDDSGDTWPAERRGAQGFAASAGACGGAVVLLHDFDRANPAADERVVANVTTRVKQTMEAGRPIVTVSDLLQ
jgi:peptidoglycan/xylan/chitin deacetylase (PgdA/CDA1 family)